jgi:hypothetical protein
MRYPHIPAGPAIGIYFMALLVAAALVTSIFFAFKGMTINRDIYYVTAYTIFSVVAILLSFVSSVLSAKGLDTPMQHTIWSIHMNIATDGITVCGAVSSVVMSWVRGKCGKVCWGWWGISIPTLVVAIVGFVSSVSSLSEDTVECGSEVRSHQINLHWQESLVYIQSGGRPMTLGNSMPKL